MSYYIALYDDPRAYMLWSDFECAVHRQRFSTNC